ncbi:hypothetical protein [Winogradskyella sp. 3972H.M.0a.05]|uniref:hypothetical protein n=1 Tax=Winogradskyella sp. 3972H.M.0a.05 TaxID=2950277 RepID=UPI003395A2B3
MNIKKITLIIVAFLAFGCSMLEKEEDKSVLIEEDRKALESKINTLPTLLYKYIKVNKKISEMDSLQLAKLKKEHPEIEDIIETNSEFKKLYNKDRNSELTALDYIRFYRTFKTSKDIIEDFDEDILPSFFENNSTGRNLTAEEIKQQKAGEHIAFAAFGLVLRDFGKWSFSYELSMVDPEIIPDGEFKAVFMIFRNLMLFQKELYYLSEHELTQNIDWIEKHPEANFYTSFNISGFGFETKENAREYILVLNYLLRGLDRLKMDNEVSEKEAMKDFETAIEIADESGANNEIIQAVKVYFYTKKENPEKAIAALQELKTSDILSDAEKKSIDEAISYIEKRETDKVLNGVYDKIFLSKIVASYMYAQAKQVDWERVLKANNINAPEELKSSLDFITDLQKNINKYSSEESIDAAQKEIKEKGLELFEKSKNVFN